jgi:hypothetical protein
MPTHPSQRMIQAEALNHRRDRTPQNINVTASIMAPQRAFSEAES